MAIIPTPRPSYGHKETPVSLGSGGGYYHNPAEIYGEEARGGGAIQLSAQSGTVTVNGRIDMDGYDGTHTGGAAGGSIWINSWKIDGTGTISADGGGTVLTADQTAGGGGGGYISIWHGGKTMDFDGAMSAQGGGYLDIWGNPLDGTYAGDGKIFIKEVEPILEDRFTGSIWNTKWWDSTNDVIIDNDLTFSNPDGTYLNPEVNSLFNVSGKEIAATIDYSPSGIEAAEYCASFRLYTDDQNWVGMARRQGGIFGISSVNGVISISGVSYPNTDVTLRLLKNDGTFVFQYYDATSTPQTLYTDHLPELADKTWRVKMKLYKPEPIPGSSFREDFFRLTPLDISNQYLLLCGTPTDTSSVTLNPIEGSSQYLGEDFYVDGNKVAWDNAGLTPSASTIFNEIIDWKDVVRVMYGWEQPLNDAAEIKFDSFKIYEGVVSSAETTEPVLYVDPIYGSDTSSGRQLDPLKNLFVATAWAKPGGTVVLYDGTHNPTSVAHKDLTLRGAEGCNSVITTEFVQDTTGSNWETNGLSFYSCHGIIENLDFTNCINGIVCENGDFSLYRNSIVDTSSAVKFSNSDPVIARNFIRSTGHALDFTSCKPPYIYSNVIADASVAVHLGETLDTTISNNTFDNNQTHIVFADAETSGTISSNNLTYSVVAVQIATDASVVSYNNNFFETFINYVGTLKDNSGDVDFNPLYYDRFNRDYHLNQGSPNIGVGLNDYDDYLYDFDGARRNNTDIGAFQYIDGTHTDQSFYVASRGDDHWNFGNIDEPFRTLDKAMLVADSTVAIEGSHYDSFYLNMKEQQIDISGLIVVLGPEQFFYTYITLSAAEVARGSLLLPSYVGIDDVPFVVVNVIGGTSQEYGVDYTIEADSLRWKGYALEPLLAVGDTLRIIFFGPLQRKSLNVVILHQHYSNYNQEKAIFVSPSGSDSTVLGGDGTNSGGTGSRELPYRTIDMALSQSNSGDNIVAMAGEYPIYYGLDGRNLVAGHDRTSVPYSPSMRYFEELFFPRDFRAYGTTEYDPALWAFGSAGKSNVFSGGGFLNFTFDGTNAATADSSFEFYGNFEIMATLRNAIDPIRFQVTSPDTTVFFSYNNSQYTTGVSGLSSVTCTGTPLGDGNAAHEQFLITEYLSITANDVRNKYAPLSYIPEPSDCSSMALNIVGGVPQNYGEDFYVEDSKVKWDGMALDGGLEPGEVLRAIYMDRSLSFPVKVSISLDSSRFVIRAFDSTWHTVFQKNMVGYYAGPWHASFVMDTTGEDISHDCIYGKGFVNKFLAVAESFDNLSIADNSYSQKTERRNIAFYEES